VASAIALSARTAWSRVGAVALIVIAADQLSKAILRSSLASGSERHVFPGLTIVHTANTGVAFSLLAGSGGAVAVLALIVLVVLAGFFAAHQASALLWLPTGMIVGGALGNLIDRVRLGAVTDFIKLPDWPAFNLADSAITLGVIALVVILGRDGTPRPR
jgi:signal peptidase II